MKSIWNPDEKSLKECFDFGKGIALKTIHSE